MKDRKQKKSCRGQGATLSRIKIMELDSDDPS